MKDYFTRLKEYIKNKYTIKNHKESLCNVAVENIMGFEIDSDVKYIYEHYKEFEISWFGPNNKYSGDICFVPYEFLEKEHGNLIEIMNECYDTDMDEYNIVQDIINWYPLFYFPNGDAFCLDTRNGTIVFYEHEVYDTGKNLHGLLIAKSINDLFEKWSSIHFADVYYWDEIVNDEGIDLNCDFAKQYVTEIS